MIYDYIIVGAGLGGLSAGLNLALHDKKVLILEKNSLPGGLVTTFKRGRFEFDTSLYELYAYGDMEHEGCIQKLLTKYGLDVITDSSMNAKIHSRVPDTTFEISENIDDFILELENLKKGSIDSLKKLLKIIEEIHDGFWSLKQGQYNKEEHSSFDKYLTMSALDAMVDIGLPKETIHRFGYLWIYLGSPLNKLSFIDFAEFMYYYIFKKPVALKTKNIDFVLQMAHNYQKFGGKIYYRSYVNEIKNGDIKEVSTKDGKKYKAKHIICDVSKRYAYTHLMKEDNKEVNRLINARTLSPRGFIIYLGLNKEHKALGLNHYHYYHFQNINSENYKTMDNLYHGTWEAIVPNIVNLNASPKGTTILIIKVNFKENAWKAINKENYQKIKEDVAKYYIEQFEQAFQIDVLEYIEEMDVATPITISRFTNNVDGAMMGSMRLGFDNAIHRLISYEDEDVEGISFVGGDSIFGGGAHNALYSGYFITEKLLEEEINNG